MVRPSGAARRRPPRTKGFLVGAVFLVAGAGLFGAAFVLPGRADTGPAETQDVSSVLAELDGAGSAIDSVTLRAAPTTADSSASPETARSQARLPAPAPGDAAPATRLRPVSGALPSLANPSRSASPSLATGPYSLAIISEGNTLDGAAIGLQEELKRRGIDAHRASLADAAHPEALVWLGAASGSSASVWFCDGEAGSDLAGVLLAALTSPPGAGAPPSDQPPALACRALHDGRVRTPAAVVLLPAREQANMNPLADGVSSYFARFGSALRQSRADAFLGWPAAGPITNYFGPSHPLGIDIGQWSGNALAAQDGTVFFAGGDPCCSYGRFVVIDHTGGIRTLYAHLDSIAVRQGEAVRRGQPVGKVGNTGNSSGPHLHFEVIDGGIRRDPLLYLP